MALKQLVDVLIVGGGPAGLAAANTLMRQLHTVVVFDSKKYRNEGSQYIHTLPTWDHKDPVAFRAAARENLTSGYDTLQIADVEIKSLKQGNDGIFEAIDASDTVWRGKKVILATGVVDVHPDLEGYSQCWVKGIFHCLFCHGYEERSASHSGILGIGDLAKVVPALHFARNALRLTPGGVTIYTDGAEDLKKDLEGEMGLAKNILVDSRPISRLSKSSHRSEVTIHFKDGSSVTEGFIGHKPKCVLRTPFDLGFEMTPQGDYKVAPPFGQTSVRGIFAAGDVTSPVKILNNALYTGALAAAGVSAQLQADELEQKSMI